MLLKILVYGWKRFWGSVQNRFDFFITMGVQVSALVYFMGYHFIPDASSFIKLMVTNTVKRW